MEFRVYEISVKNYLLKNIDKNNMFEVISEVIDSTLSRNKEFLEFHNKNCYKNYCNNGFYPLETDGIYKEDNIYTFQIRTIDEDLAKYLIKNLANTSTKFIKVLKTDIKIISRKHIDKVFSITPIVIKDSTGYWKGNISLDEFENRIKTNLIKKYNSFTGDKIDEDFEFYTRFEFKNNKPIAVNYKNIKLLGDKIQLNIADDEISQTIAYMALGTGLGENNSRGAGFVGFRWL
ncbi:CRISPR-associated endoribonuclease Cas6 [Clostridium sp. NSJ-49]|uniref:CRISPR-associated endoribonuclease Cas6 n=1 Tax=Clostridium TaxID=1485 RepID=UPI00164C61BE|nr:CRISPR-associated endoribonuclease Cas6 [Clostridium sp. NSJ-49]MBC5624416.1 CRISPR-associated endoribonuclease Cas6 [Clostridium sp. NSJ-49]